MTVPSVGDPAPDFTLRDQHGADVTLAELRGTPVVLLFYPFAFSRVCSGELRAIRDDLPAFGEDVHVLGLSCDPMFALRVFADQDRLDFPLLSDFWPHGAVAKAFGVFNEERGSATRGTFVIDRDGIVRWTVVHWDNSPRDDADYRVALAELD